MRPVFRDPPLIPSISMGDGHAAPSPSPGATVGPRPVSTRLAKETDYMLVQRAARGELGALGDLYDRHKATAYSLACRITKDAILAEDVVHDAFLAVWRNAARYVGTNEPVQTWLLAIVDYRARVALRRRQMRAVVTDVEPSRVGHVERDVWA